MKILKREKFVTPIHVSAGDTIKLNYKEPYKEEKCVLQHIVKETMIADEGIIFEFEEDDVEGWQKGLGGVFGTSK